MVSSVSSPGEAPQIERGSPDARENCQAPARAGVRDPADDDGPMFSTVAKLVDAPQRAAPHSSDLELKLCGSGANCSAGPSTRKSDEQAPTQTDSLGPLYSHQRHRT